LFFFICSDDKYETETKKKYWREGALKRTITKVQLFKIGKYMYTYKKNQMYIYFFFFTFPQVDPKDYHKKEVFFNYQQGYTQVTSRNSIQ